MERQDAKAYARQPQDSAEIADWGRIQDVEDADATPVDDPTLDNSLPADLGLWLAKSDALAADILARRKGKPLDIDALLQGDRADLEARDEAILKGATP
jgi:hypothetical protein